MQRSVRRIQFIVDHCVRVVCVHLVDDESYNFTRNDVINHSLAAVTVDNMRVHERWR